ncbi:50S ribosomal protein L30 [Candidatus Woesearchaeota archaeon]|nr:50S ribosomal protein L30 [Candidatus Woesearchaeota archaeon]
MEKKSSNILAVIRLRGPAKLNSRIDDTMKMLRLYKANNCTVVPNSKNYLGMIQKAKDFLTWGEIDSDTFKILLEKKGRLPGNKPLTKEYLMQKTKLSIEDFGNEFFSGKKSLKDIPGLKTFFRLSPPRKGLESGGIKKPYSMGGALGYRKDHINELIRRMI